MIEAASERLSWLWAWHVEAMIREAVKRHGLSATDWPERLVLCEMADPEPSVARRAWLTLDGVPVRGTVELLRDGVAGLIVRSSPREMVQL